MTHKRRMHAYFRWLNSFYIVHKCCRHVQCYKILVGLLGSSTVNLRTALLRNSRNPILGRSAFEGIDVSDMDNANPTVHSIGTDQISVRNKTNTLKHKSSEHLVDTLMIITSIKLFVRCLFAASWHLSLRCRY